jgi:hypothetical protein
MQTIDYSCIRPNRPTAFLRRLCRLLVLDEARHRPPISLPGRPRPVQPPPPPVDRASGWVRLDCTSKLYGPAEPGDERLPYSREQLVRMDERFSQRLKRAFAAGRERRGSAGLCSTASR